MKELTTEKKIAFCEWYLKAKFDRYCNFTLALSRFFTGILFTTEVFAKSFPELYQFKPDNGRRFYWFCRNNKRSRDEIISKVLVSLRNVK